jgi:hypothetical protein
MQYQMFRNLKDGDVIQARDEVVGGYINKWSSLEPGANAIGHVASFYDETPFRFRRKVDSAPKFKQHDPVKICNKDSKFFGVTGRIVGVRVESLGFVYRVKYDVPQDVEQYKYSWYIESELKADVPFTGKFKVGQRVVLAKPVWLPASLDNHFGTIEQTLGNGERPFDYIVRFDNGMTCPVKESEIKLETVFLEGFIKGPKASTKPYRFCNNWHLEVLPSCVNVNLKYADLPVSKYRYLKIGEKIREGDEYNSVFDEWKSSICIGNTIVPYDSRNNVYRRKIS